MIEEITKKINLEVEIDAVANKASDNPYIKWIHIAKTIDAYRIFPRVFVSVYIVLLYKVVTLVSVVVGAMAAVFGIYAGTSGQSKKFKGED